MIGVTNDSHVIRTSKVIAASGWKASMPTKWTVHIMHPAMTSAENSVHAART